MKNADPVALRKHIVELQAVKEDALSRGTENKSVQMDTLLELPSENNRNSVLESEAIRLLQLLAEAHTERGKGAAN